MTINIAQEMAERAKRAADELQRMADQIETPTGPGSAKEMLAGLAVAVRWLVEDHSTMSALADSLDKEKKADVAVLEALKCCEMVLDTAAILGLPQQLPEVYRDSWAAAHQRARAALFHKLRKESMACPTCGSPVEILEESIAGHLRDGKLCDGSYKIAYPPTLIRVDPWTNERVWRLADGREVTTTKTAQDYHHTTRERVPREFLRHLKELADEQAYSEEMHRQNPAPDALEVPEDHRMEDGDLDDDGNAITEEDDDPEY